ncbi:hypothetical protein PVAND_014491 [Polypedilum vanderplanki]|uniref:Uncharacterized protein n=1 Tax=Polypedilum vanderplanki TaxID=319348 RepID=A0A9J6BA53_POLVA|nr:hypothetical protein PVAND_014491 [Polypedilum vanderplanki]
MIKILKILLFITAFFSKSCPQNLETSSTVDDSDETLTNTESESVVVETTETLTEDSQNDSAVTSNSCNAAENKQKCCKDLNQQRANFTACCEYPMLVVLTSQRNECVKKCSETSIPPTNCCILNCCLQKIKVMNQSMSRSEINAEYFAYSFLNSVNNEKKWFYPIMSSVSSCYNEIAVDKSRLMNDENLWACDGKVPKYFYDLVDCSYERNFLNCPVWNPSNLPECELSRRYVIECLITPKSKTKDENTNLMN